MRSGRRCLAATVVLLASAAAHEIGTTRVSIDLKADRTFAVEIVTDAGTLLDRLRCDPRTPECGAAFFEKVHLQMDGVEARPALALAIVQPAANIRLSGRIPDGARQLTWMYGWTFASYSVTVRAAASTAESTFWLEGGETSAPINIAIPSPPPLLSATILRYLELGFTHIVPRGFDHVLFVLGIFLLSRRPRSVLAQVSAFTVAHSITLGLNMYGVIALPSRFVEPVIALSIAYVAIENLLLAELRKWRIGLVFAFGLLHGLGFASALKEVGLPRSEFLIALLAFNTGVEAAQLAVIGAAFLAVGWYCANRPWYRSRIVMPASALIACTALYWTVERLSS